MSHVCKPRCSPLGQWVALGELAGNAPGSLEFAHTHLRATVTATHRSCPPQECSVGCGSAPLGCLFPAAPGHSITDPRVCLPNQPSYSCRERSSISPALETGTSTWHQTLEQDPMEQSTFSRNPRSHTHCFAVTHLLCRPLWSPTHGICQHRDQQ